MALSYKARRRWALVILILGLPLYIMFAAAGAAIMTALLGRPPIWAEVLLYAVLGIIWALPFKFIFLGIGQADPDATPEQEADDSAD